MPFDQETWTDVEWEGLDQATIEGPVFSTVKPTVAIFDDMLETTSPGALPDGITPEVPFEMRLESVVDGEMSSKQQYPLTSKGRGF